MHMSGVKISENAESFLCETKAVRGVVVETLDLQKPSRLVVLIRRRKRKTPRLRQVV